MEALRGRKRRSLEKAKPLSYQKVTQSLPVFSSPLYSMYQGRQASTPRAQGKKFKRGAVVYLISMEQSNAWSQTRIKRTSSASSQLT